MVTVAGWMVEFWALSPAEVEVGRVDGPFWTCC